MIAIGIEFGYLLSLFDLSSMESSTVSVPKPKAGEVVQRLEAVNTHIEELELSVNFKDLEEWIEKIHQQYGPFEMEDDEYKSGNLLKTIKRKTAKAFKNRRTLNKKDQKDMYTKIMVWIDRLGQINFKV